MVASARFCSSPVSATAAQETLKRFQYESIQTLVPLSLSPRVSPTLFSHHHFFHRFFRPNSAFQLLPLLSFPLLYLTVFFYRFYIYKILTFSPLFPSHGSGKQETGKNLVTYGISFERRLPFRVVISNAREGSGICIYRSTKKRQQSLFPRLIERNVNC